MRIDRPGIPTERLLALVAGCCAALVWCIAPALEVVADQAIAGSGLAAPGWVSVIPWWSALLAVPAAWIGTYGAPYYLRRGWNLALRPLEGLGLVVVCAVCVQISGGYRFAPGAPLWPALVATAPLIPVAGAWGLGMRLANGLLPALGFATADERTEALEIQRTAYCAVLGQWLFWTAAAAGCWAIASYAVKGAPAYSAWAAVGASVFVVLGLAVVAALHRGLVALEFGKAGVHIHPSFAAGAGGGAVWLTIAPAVAAMLLPVNLSPFRAWNFNHWMERLTERIGPLLVPSQAPGRRFGEEISRFSLERALNQFAGRGPGSAELPLVIWILLLLALLFVFWRVFRHAKRTTGGAARMGRLPLGIGWLYEQVRAALIRLLYRLGLLRDPGRLTRPAPSGQQAPSRTPRRSRKALRPNVTRIYISVLDRFERRGFARHRSETPLEYLERWRSAYPDGDAGGLASLTGLYLDERYGAAAPTETALRRAREAAALALRAGSRWVSALRSRLGRRDRKASEGKE